MAKLGPLPDAPGAVKIRLLGNMPGGSKWVNVLHAKVTGTLTQGTLDVVADIIRGYWVSDIAPLVSSTSSLTTVEITDISSRTGLQSTNITGGAGTGNALNAPNSAAACLSLKIGTRYRGGHPRMYLPGVQQGAIINGNTWNTGIAALYQTGGRAFRAHINSIVTGSTTWAMCAVSYYHKVNGVEAYKVPPDLYVITDVVCHTRVDSMRRRLGKELS